MTAAVSTSDREIVISRVFDAQRELVWAAYTEPKHVVNWFGPFPTVNPACEMDLRVGGSFRWTMISPDGAKFAILGEYQQIVKPERLVYTQRSDNPPEFYDKINAARGAPKGTPLGSALVTVTFATEAGKTRLTITTLYSAAEIAKAFRNTGFEQGTAMMFDRLAAELAKSAGDAAQHEVTVARTFNAPRALVFKMWTDPKHLVHWAIPRGFHPPIIDHVDARTGGSLQMIMRCTDGNIYLSKWSFVEVVDGVRLVYDEVCDENGKPFHRSRQTVDFAEQDGKTTVTVHGRIDLVPGRDPRWTIELMKDGWAEGWNENFDLLEKYLATSPEPK